MGPIAENGVPNVVKMWDLHIVHEDAVLHLSRMTDDAPIASDNSTPQICSTSDLTILADYRRSFDHHTVLNHCSLTD
jgi:hypothetical protein